MSEGKETGIIDDAEIVQKENNTANYTGYIKFYIVLAIILAATGWGFWTFAPVTTQFKKQWLPNTKSVETVEIPKAEEPVEEPAATPIFKPSYDITPAPEEEDSKPETIMQVENLDDVTQAVQQLQQQVLTLQQTILNMHQQQLEQSQQQVRSHLFTLLQHANRSQTSLTEAATTWKSISLMPLLNDDKVALAQKGYEDLQNLNHAIQDTSDEMDSIITTLTQQLEPEEKLDIIVTDKNVLDPYQDIIVDETWIDWLMQQFRISKVDPETLIINDDPYADTKQLIAKLQQLQASITATHWHRIHSLNKLLYQLEQRGIDTSLSHELLNGFKLTQQTWQAEARAWMEQL